MSHSETVRELASILNPQNEARPTVLLGAGASFSSGVPLADESVKRIARRYYAERIVGGKVLPEQVKTSEWMAWLGEQDWFVRDPAKLPENFPLAVKHLLTPQRIGRTMARNALPDRRRVVSFHQRVCAVVG